MTFHSVMLLLVLTLPFFTILLKYFSRRVKMAEKIVVLFLCEPVSPQEADPCHRGFSVMQEKQKRHRDCEYKPVHRCPRKAAKPRSFRKGSHFSIIRTSTRDYTSV